MIYAPAGAAPAHVDSLLYLTVYVPIIVAFTAIFYLCLRPVLNRDYAVPEKPLKYKWAERFRQRPFLVAFIVLLIAWTPYIAFCYPGNVSFDGARQMRQALGTEGLTNQHPVMGTLLIGLFFRIGQVVNDNFGIFFIVLMQTLLTAAAIALCEKKILKLTNSVRFSLLSLAFFSINPIWGLYEQTIVKDTPFTGLFLLYSLSYVELAEQVLDKTGKKAFEWKNAAFLAVSGALCSMIRHGEVVIIALSMLAMVVFAAKERWKTALLMVVTIAVSVGGSRTLVAITDAGSPPTRATFSVFFQQTALYMRKHPGDVTPEQYAAIDAVLDAATIGERYDPLKSDPVKETYNTEAGREELAAYFKAWFEMFKVHPDTYLDSFLQFAYSYIEPFHCATEKRVFFVNFTLVEGVDMQYAYRNVKRSALKRFTEHLVAAPVIQQLFFPGTYFWICTACFLLLWKKRRGRMLVVCVLPMLRVLMCLASPVAGYFRYALPLLIITPLMMAWASSQAAAADAEKNK